MNIVQLLKGNNTKRFITEVADTGEMFIVSDTDVVPVSEDSLLDALNQRNLTLGEIKAFTNGVYVYKLASQYHMLQLAALE
jgi:hypothetical protein